jgi:RNA polymerase sigma factor (sigma-70 family)
MTLPLDNGVIPAFHKNDPEAVQAILREHFASMAQYAGQLVNNQPEAEEITVATFVKLIAMRQNFKTLADIRAFLLVTIRNSSYDYLASLDIERPSPAELLSLADLKPAPKEGVIQPFTTEMVAALYDAIPQLEPAVKEVFDLYFYNKMTTTGIATQLAIPVSTVRDCKAQAVKALKAALSKKNGITPSAT